jgi:hypothetical protein
VGQPAPARVVGTAETARSVTADDSSGCGATYGSGLRVDHWNSESISSWQTGRQLPEDDSQRRFQWRQATAGHISKQGNSLLRFLLVEAAHAAARNNADWRHRYVHSAKHRHKSIAKVAMRRRLGVLGMRMTKPHWQQPYPSHATQHRRDRQADFSPPLIDISRISLRRSSY